MTDATPGPYFLDLAGLGEGEAALYDSAADRVPGWLAFRSPVRILRAAKVEEVSKCLEEASDFAESGGYAVGFLSYEAASGLNPAHRTKEPRWPVLAWFALYETPPSRHRELLPCYQEVPLLETCPELDRESYGERFNAVKSALAHGVSYQVNLTFRIRMRIGQPADRLFASRCGTDPPRYAALLCGGDWSIASFSPELLFERNGDAIVSRPMKGTSLVPDRPELVAPEAEHLAHDPKSRAENVMIVDMVRNDLGSICDTGSIAVRDLLKVERHRGLFQMTSSVYGRSRARTSDLLRRLFPAASVTGAPKVSTMERIRDLEPSPRHAYCGAIGIMGPESQRFSVAIRTALLHQGGTGEFGVGSGIVWDSCPDAEYAECLAKCERLEKKATQWQLVEAMSNRDLADPRLHLERLERSAARFGIPFNRPRLLEELTELGIVDQPKVRISLRLDGEYRIQTGPSEIKANIIRARVAREPVQQGDPNLTIKSTSRAIFLERLDDCRDVDEVLLYNQFGELTEFTRGSVLLEMDGRLWTPHPDSGCLDGIGVRRMLEQGAVAYRNLKVEDLSRASHVLFLNSVKGMVQVSLIE